MTTDFRALCAELLDELKYQTDWSVAEELKDRARAALTEPQPPIFLDAIRLAKGSHDYSGGYGGTPCAEAFHAGIGTVVNVLTKAATGPWDYQTQAVFRAAEDQPPADGEVGYLVRYLRYWGDHYSNATEFHRAADLLKRLAQDHVPGVRKMVQPIPVSERLPEAGK